MPLRYQWRSTAAITPRTRWSAVGALVLADSHIESSDGLGGHGSIDYWQAAKSLGVSVQTFCRLDGTILDMELGWTASPRSLLEIADWIDDQREAIS